MCVGGNGAIVEWAVQMKRLPADATLEQRVERNEVSAEQIRTLLQKIKDYEEGAFAPLSQHPVVAALAMPFGGAGILTLLDFLAAR